MYSCYCLPMYRASSIVIVSDRLKKPSASGKQNCSMAALNPTWQSGKLVFSSGDGVPCQSHLSLSQILNHSDSC